MKIENQIMRFYNIYMIVVYTSPGCASCRKVKAWLKEHNLPFIEKNIFQVALNKTEIMYLMQRSENGTDDIISKRSKIIQENNYDIDAMSTNELVDFIIQNPSILRRPIILNDKEFQIGYDSEEIDAFDEAELRKLAVCDETCPKYVSGECPIIPCDI